MAASLVIFGVILLLLLGVSALFSAAETALTRASRGRMHQLEREGDPAAKRVNRLLDNQETMIGAVLLGYNLINILSSAVATEFITQSVPGAWGVALATAVMTALVLVFAEVLPKTIAIGRADDVARVLSAPMLVVVRLFGPLIYAIQWLVRLMLRPFGLHLSMEADVLAAHEEIRGAVEYHHSEGLVESRDRRMLGGVLDLAEMNVSQVMVHRKSLVMVDADLPPRELVRQVLDAPYTRLPLYRDEAENIIGVLHAKDLLRAIRVADGDLSRVDVGAIASPPWFVPEMRPLSEQLKAFRRRKAHFALVVDEYGEVEGLVTLEDILEEIVGDISDEHDVVVAGVRAQPDGSVVVDGSVPIRDLNRAMDWNLPDEEATTVAGLVIHEARSIPERGQSFTFHGFRFRVLRRERNRITALRIVPLAVEAEPVALPRRRAGTSF
jgi:Mg2+/Co2+ transporter CorB